MLMFTTCHHANFTHQMEKSFIQSPWSVFFILELLHTFKNTKHGLTLLTLLEFACSSFLVGLLMMTGVIRYQDKVDLQ